MLMNFKISCSIFNFSCLVQTVPFEFAKTYLSRTSEYVKLQISGGREWPVRITIRDRLCLTKGWKVFSKENSLEEGDVCVLELTKDIDVVLKVSIFRAAEDSGPLN